MATGLHITLTTFTHGSRILKETASLVESGLVQHIYIVALYGTGLEEHEGIDRNRTVWRMRLWSRKLPRFLLFQIIKYLELCARCLWFAKAKKMDFINVHHLGLLPYGVLASWFCDAKLIYDTHELETETYGLKGFRQALARCVERKLIRYAELIIVVSDGIKDWYSKEYKLSNIVTVLNCPKSQKPKCIRRLHNSLGISKKKKIVLYQGGFQKGRGIESLLKVFAENEDKTHVLVLMGYGDLEPLIRKHVQKYDNIYAHAAVAPEMVLQYTASADIGVSYIDNPSLNDRFCLPNKLFEYIMAKLPVIVNDAPEMRRVVNEHQIGCVIQGDLTVESCNKALESISQVDPQTMRRNLKVASELYCWENQEKLMIAAYKRYVTTEH